MDYRLSRRIFRKSYFSLITKGCDAFRKESHGTDIYLLKNLWRLCNFGEKSFQSKKRAADMANSVALFYMPKTFYYHNLSPKLYKSDWFIFLSKISFTIILH